MWIYFPGAGKATSSGSKGPGKGDGPQRKRKGEEPSTSKGPQRITIVSGGSSGSRKPRGTSDSGRELVRAQVGTTNPPPEVGSPVARRRRVEQDIEGGIEHAPGTELAIVEPAIQPPQLPPSQIARPSAVYGRGQVPMPSVAPLPLPSFGYDHSQASSLTLGPQGNFLPGRPPLDYVRGPAALYGPPIDYGRQYG